MSSISDAVAAVHLAHKHVVRRDAGFGVGLNVSAFIVNALWKVSNVALTATSTAISSYPDPTVTLSMTATTGFFGSAIDFGTCFAKREEAKNTLDTFMKVLMEMNPNNIATIKYRNILGGSQNVWVTGENIKSAWEGCVEMEIKLSDMQQHSIKLSNVNNIGSKYMLAHAIAAVASLTILAANLGMNGENLVRAAHGDAKDTLPSDATSTMLAIGTIPIMTFTNWFTTLCLQQEKQIAKATKHILQNEYRGNPYGHDDIIKLLTKLKEFTPEQIVKMSSRPDAPATADNISFNSEHQSDSSRVAPPVMTGTQLENLFKDELAAEVVAAMQERRAINMEELKRTVTGTLRDIVNKVGITDNTVITDILEYTSDFFKSVNDIVGQVKTENIVSNAMERSSGESDQTYYTADTRSSTRSSNSIGSRVAAAAAAFAQVTEDASSLSSAGGEWRMGRKSNASAPPRLETDPDLELGGTESKVNSYTALAKPGKKFT